ncbi:hypothetical protein [Rhodococcus sp. IEGM 1379]|uniref:hypothetical protein n=1 Tax=Rhodococcus sp. IEGM 1379 TaxID=3047086 RepID=UPI0024B7107A|nr:hypothetical protein [Rhodococcus sp. IEGM 1379]MDI9917081.1 hypothetical protein [Rhodococcus sp. IEGM 1379]
MSGWRHRLTVADLYTSRNAYGQNMSGLVPPTGPHILEAGWWTALTGAPDPSYNLALVHDGDIARNISEVLDRVMRAYVRAVVMLAGRGLGDARSLAEDLFGVDADSAALVYSAGSISSKRRVIGLFDDGKLHSAAMLSPGNPISTVWAGGTRKGGQRRGNGLRMLRQVSAAAFAEVGEYAVCGLASPAGERLYDLGGVGIVGYWQMWSRPRRLPGS